MCIHILCLWGRNFASLVSGSSSAAPQASPLSQYPFALAGKLEGRKNPWLRNFALNSHLWENGKPSWLPFSHLKWVWATWLPSSSFSPPAIEHASSRSKRCQFINPCIAWQMRASAHIVFLQESQVPVLQFHPTHLWNGLTSSQIFVCTHTKGRGEEKKMADDS